jgi:hypothetical protein
MFTRYPTAITAALLVIGLALGTLGLLTDHNTAIHGGILATLAALPTLIVAMLRAVHRVADEQLAAAHADGYRLGVQHCARGLLTPRPTGPGNRAGHVDQDHRSNVVPFRRIQQHAKDHERKAQ